MRAQYGRFGPKKDYRGAHVTLSLGGRTLLGEVVEVRYRDVSPCGFFATVRHFNGEPWPTEPSLAVLEILERN